MGKPPLMITEDQCRHIDQILLDLLQKTNARAVFLCDYGGHIITKKLTSAESSADHTIAALASGAFAATNELAALIGEPKFSSIYHKGDKASMYMHSVRSDHIIFVIFTKATAVGLVKMCVENTSRELSSFLGDVETHNSAANPAMTQAFVLNDEAAPIFAINKPK